MREASEIEVYLKRLIRPVSELCSRFFRPIVTCLAFIAKHGRSVWYRYWCWVQADEVVSVRGISQRAAYQRIMISAQAGIGLLVTLFVSVSYLQRPDMVTVEARRPVKLWDMRVPDKSKVIAETYPGAKRNIPRDEEGPKGFQGFINLTSEEAGLAPETPVPSDIYTVSDTTFHADQPISFSPIGGELDTVIIPINAEYLDSDFEPEIELVNRPPFIVDKKDPEFPPVYRIDHLIEGFVSIQVSINEKGKLEQFSPLLPDNTVLEETWYYVQVEFTRSLEEQSDGTRVFGQWKRDQGTFFAKNIGKVIRDWVFGPAIQDSRPVSSDLTISFYFCLNYPNCKELTLDSVLKEVVYSSKLSD